MCDTGVRAFQENYVKEIPSLPKGNALKFAGFCSIRAKYAYLAYSTMPDILVIVAKLSQVTEDIYSKDEKHSIKLLRRLENEIVRGTDTRLIRLYHCFSFWN